MFFFVFFSPYHNVILIEKGRRYERIITNGKVKLIWDSYCVYVNGYEYRFVQYKVCIGCII